MRKTIVSFVLVLVAVLGACHTSSSQAPAPAPSPAPGPEPTPAPEPSAGGAGGDCVPSGCSGTVCVAVGKEVITTCEFKNEYACYQKAKCEKQANGECGWTKSGDFDACIAAGGPKQ